MTTAWRKVSKAEPCALCEKPDWCGRSDGVARCMRVSEPPPGWRVVKRCSDGGTVFAPADNRPCETRVSNSWRKRAEQFRGGLAPEGLSELAEALHVSSQSLVALGAGSFNGCWTFPEYDGQGNVIGITRRFPDAAKKSMAGSKRGLSIPNNLADTDDPILIVEGPSDVAACHTLGLSAVGRPSNRGGAPMLAELLAGRECIVLGENDQKPDGAWPGRDGAESIARALAERWGCPVRWALPPKGVKDVRDFLSHFDLDDPERLANLGLEFLEEIEAGAETATADVAVATMAEPPLPWEPFPTEALPEPVRSFVEQGAKAIGCDPSYVALPMLSALASAIGNTRHIQLKRGWTEAPIIWTAIVGESGTLKTPAFKLAIGPIRVRQNAALRRHNEEVAEYEVANVRYDKALTAWKRAKPGDDDPPEKPQPPNAVRYVVSDTTVEALAPILLANPRGLLMARDELSGWIGSFDRYASGRGGADVASWLSMHNGESVVVDRKTGQPRTIYVPSAAVSVTGGVQPGILDRVLVREHRDSGLLARLLLAMPPARRKRWTESEVQTSTELAIEHLFDRLVNLEADHDDRGAWVPRIVMLSPKGRQVWITFANAHGEEQHELTGDLRAAWSKLEGYAARLALVVHLVRSAANDPALGDHDQVDEASVAAGAAMSGWFGREARRIYDRWAESDHDRADRQLVEFIQAKGGCVGVRDVQRGCRRWLGTADHVRRALQRLVERGLGCWRNPAPGRNGGAPKAIFFLFSHTSGATTPADGTLLGGSVTVTGVTPRKSEEGTR